ncbi:GNAT family N-acetyltransferase [Reichenbachiella sp. MALMAid0571]|uniref:GNAT family N-acetyltransferase n=1 Tax=Reichenbachiella sp. MALMAid0571 TaxID=3143939 RepID=UPI0032DEEE80
MKELTEVLNSSHRKKEFCCGKGLLDNYFQKQANQDIKRKLSACFVLNDEETDLIKGYYTLANNSIPLILIPERFQKKLPKSYNSIPTTLLGRLAIDNRFQGKGIGKLLLVDALRRSYEISKSVGSFAVVVDPIDDEAEQFYDKYGFIKLPDSGKMFLPMNTIKTLFE